MGRWMKLFDVGLETLPLYKVFGTEGTEQGLPLGFGFLVPGHVLLEPFHSGDKSEALGALMLVSHPVELNMLLENVGAEKLLLAQGAMVGLIWAPMGFQMIGQLVSP